MPDQKLDFSFDRRVSETYDKVRAHPPNVSNKIGQAICAVTGKNARILELGVGTGRIALPVVAAGCDVVGVDISRDMLRHVSASAAERNLEIHTVQADIAKLPFASNAFDAVTTVHVLHLVADWQSALSGAAQSLKPNGCLILGRDWVDPESVAGELQNVFRKTVVDLMGPQLKAPTGASVIADYIEDVAGRPEHFGPTDIVAAEWSTSDSPAGIINSIRTRTFPESWILTDEFMEPVIERINAYAEERWADTQAPIDVTRRFLLSVFRKRG